MAEANKHEVVQEFLPLVRVYRDGRVERLMGNQVVPASVDRLTGVQSKDVVISPKTGLSARLYLPKTESPCQKLPLLVYFHGGGFVIESAFSPTYQVHLNSLAAQANVVVASINYPRAPENPVPAAFEGSWAAVKWVASNALCNGHEPWLKNHVDFDRVFFGGDSAGANIAHHMGIRVGSEFLHGFKLVGIFLSCPYFWGTKSVGNETTDANTIAYLDRFWRFVCPTTSGLDDPLMNPVMDPKLSRLACSKVLVLIAEKDLLRQRGWFYSESLAKSGWGGKVDIVETKGEDHVFYLYNPPSDKSIALVKSIAAFLNEDYARPKCCNGFSQLVNQLNNKKTARRCAIGMS